MKLKCAQCDDKQCLGGKDCYGFADRHRAIYRSDEGKLEMARVSAATEAWRYLEATRLEELVHFARGMGFEHLGLAFCFGLPEEARTLADILERNGFRVSSVICKACGISKDDLGLERILPAHIPEGMCNPIGQAELLNGVETQINVVLGLCVGHDALFTMHSKAPVTTFATKDRALGHNPMSALYNLYNKMRYAKPVEE